MNIFARETFNCVKYKNSSYNKGSLLWDSLPVVAWNSVNMIEFERQLGVAYKQYVDELF